MCSSAASMFMSLSRRREPFRRNVIATLDSAPGFSARKHASTSAVMVGFFWGGGIFRIPFRVFGNFSVKPAGEPGQFGPRSARGPSRPRKKRASGNGVSGSRPLLTLVVVQLFRLPWNPGRVKVGLGSIRLLKRAQSPHRILDIATLSSSKDQGGLRLFFILEALFLDFWYSSTAETAPSRGTVRHQAA